MSSSYDALFASVFSQPEHVASELRTLLPLELSKRFDWSTLTRHPASFVDERLIGFQGGLLFTVRCEGREACLYVVFEQPSPVETISLVSELSNQARIWGCFLAMPAEGRALPTIIFVKGPHGGDAGWTAKTDPLSLSLIAADRERLSIAAGSRGGPNLLDALRDWQETLVAIAVAPNGLADLSSIMEFVFRVAEVQPEELRQLALEIGPVAQEAYMTAAQILTKESYAQGRAEGEAKGRVEGKAELIIQQLGLRFGPLSDAVRERILHAWPDHLDVWAERIITRATLEEVIS